MTWYEDEVTHVTPDQWAHLAELTRVNERNRKGLILSSRPQDNHEVWKVCANCGAWFDARWGWICPDCNHDNTP